MPFPNFDTIGEWFGDNQSGNPWRIPFLVRQNIIRPDADEALVPCNVATLAFPILDLNTANGAIVSVEPLLDTAMPRVLSGNYSVIQTGGSGGVVSLHVNGGLPDLFFVDAGGSGYTTGYATLTGGYPVYIGVNSGINSDMSKVALPNLTTVEAGANGDVRKVYFAIIDQLAQAYLEKATANRPVKMVVTKSTSVNATTGVLTTNYNFQFQLYSTGLEVVDE